MTAVENCPDPRVHGNPFRYCPYCDWVEAPADPGRSGGEGTGWHRHADGHVVPDAECADTEHIEGIYGPLETRIVLDPVTARDTIARALWMRSNPRPPDWDAWPEWDRNGFLADADAVLAALASQERGE